MTKNNWLAILLRVVGISGLFALFAVVMPTSWMAGTHRWLGLGEIPAAPVVEYLTRSLSVFYALFGAVCLMLAGDVERYGPVVRWLGVFVALAGVILTGVDLAAPMPAWWTLLEGPPTIGMGLLVYFLAR